MNFILKYFENCFSNIIVFFEIIPIIFFLYEYCFSGFPFIVWGSGGWTRVCFQLLGAFFFRVFLRDINSVSPVFCYVDVAVSIGEAANTPVFCYIDVAMSIGKASKPCAFCDVDVAVSVGEAAKPRVFS